MLKNTVETLSELHEELWEHYNREEEHLPQEIQNRLTQAEELYNDYQTRNYLTDTVMLQVYPALYYYYKGSKQGEPYLYHMDGVYPAELEHPDSHTKPIMVIKSGMNYHSAVPNGSIFLTTQGMLGEVMVYDTGGQLHILSAPEEVVYLGSPELHYVKQQWKSQLHHKLQHLRRVKDYHLGKSEPIPKGSMRERLGISDLTIPRYDREEEHRFMREMETHLTESKKMYGYGVQSSLLYHNSEEYEEYLLLVRSLDAITEEKSKTS